VNLFQLNVVGFFISGLLGNQLERQWSSEWVRIKNQCKATKNFNVVIACVVEGYRRMKYEYF